MLPAIWFIFIGLVVGTLVGLTGLGGGTLMTPLLILSGLPAVLAIGTDIVYAAFTKLFASILHIREKNVEYKIVLILLSGSIPGIFVGYFFSQIITENFGTDGLNLILTYILSILLISLSLISIITELIKAIMNDASDQQDDLLEGHQASEDLSPNEEVEMSFMELVIQRQTFSIILGAFAVGLLVQLTSIGSGVLITVILLNILPAKKVVGTELVHASIIVGISAIIYSSAGLVYYDVLWKILLGAFFGIIFGVRFSKKIPAEKFKLILFSVIFFAGILVLYEGTSR